MLGLQRATQGQACSTVGAFHLACCTTAVGRHPWGLQGPCQPSSTSCNNPHGCSRRILAWRSWIKGNRACHGLSIALHRLRHRASITCCGSACTQSSLQQLTDGRRAAGVSGCSADRSCCC